MKVTRCTLACILLLAFIRVPSFSQFLENTPEVAYDTSFIKVYTDELTTRLYLSRKQNGYTLADALLKPWIKYRTNDKILLGMGYTYSFLTINLGIKLPLINQDDNLYGESRYFDLQTHFMFRSYIVDLYLQWNSGHYLSNPQDVFYNWDGGNYMPQRGDMRTSIVGLNVQHLFNSDRYSYKASFWQNEFQKRSAGSPILGLEAYWMLGMSDSIMVEGAIPPMGFMDEVSFNRADVMHVGLNGGYAHTFVWMEKLYLSLSTTMGLSGAYNKVQYTPDSHTLSRGLSLGATNTTRISMGYDTGKYYFGLSFSRFWMNSMAKAYQAWYGYNTGHFRINFVRRFTLKQPIKLLRPDLWNLKQFKSKRNTESPQSKNF